MRACVFFLLFAPVLLADPAQTLMPLPAKMTAGTGSLQIDRTFHIGFSGYQEPRLTRAAQRLTSHLLQKTGMPLDTAFADPAQATLEIHCEKAGLPVQAWDEDESYRLEVGDGRAKLTAPNPLGALRGMETFLQLVELTPTGYVAPNVSIEDRPRFAWRGLMMDVCRHWMPLAVVKRNLDGMAAVKFNVFHWHLSDDQGFRIESKRYPLLQQKGSSGNYYTQDQVREVLTYARDRGIRVVPEFDIPGHTSSWLLGYPVLASARGKVSLGTTFALIDPLMDPTRETTYTLLDGFLGEMSRLFPDAYLHIGGDEVNAKQWKANRRIQQFNRTHGGKTSRDLQAYFNKRILRILQKHNKRMMGWDEILHPDLPKQVVVQSWRGQNALARSAEEGYLAILSHGYYLDHVKPAEYHYLIEPYDQAAELTPEQRTRILGGEACMWAEFVNAETVDSRIWPRAAAIAERFWSPQEVRDVDSMYRRLALVSGELDQLGLQHRANYRIMLQRLTGGQPVDSLRTLADVVEPVKGYVRTRRRPEYTTDTPLNRLVDAARPESEPAREFNKAAERVAAGAPQPDDLERLRNWLTRWRENDRALAPAIQGSALLEEVAPLSRDLSRLGEIGLQALQYMDSKQAAPPSWKGEADAALEQAKEPRAEVILMVVPGVKRLVDTASVALSGAL